ncbi:Uncharacterised protein [Vibrio cholerae]|nr:Uncharacterised protein [Vibrio cholerae]
MKPIFIRSNRTSKRIRMPITTPIWRCINSPSKIRKAFGANTAKSSTGLNLSPR